MPVISPDKLVGARSPIYITLDYDSAASSLVDASLKVYIWDGARTSKPSTAQYTLKRDVFAGKIVSFDVAPLVSEYIQGTYSSTAITAASIAEASTVVWVEVDYVVNYYNKADPPVIVNDTGSQDIFPASNGYHTFSEGANYEYPSTFLVDTAKVYIEESGNEAIPICIGEYNAEDVAKVTYDSLAGNRIDIDLTSFEDPTQPEGSIVKLPIGETNLTTYLTALGFTGTMPTDVDSYLLQLKQSDDTVIDTLTVDKICEPKYTINTIEFVNRYGAWQHLHFFKASSDSINITSEEYRRILGSSTGSGFTYSTTDDLYKKYNTNGKKLTTINTGWVEEDFKETIQSLLMSERVLMNGSPVVVNTSSLRLQKAINDKMINYTLEVEEAFDTRYV